MRSKRSVFGFFETTMGPSHCATNLLVFLLALLSARARVRSSFIHANNGVRNHNGRVFLLRKAQQKQQHCCFRTKNHHRMFDHKVERQSSPTLLGFSRSPATTAGTTTTALQSASTPSLSSLAAASSLQKSLHGSPVFVLTAVLWLSTFGISLERRTMLGKALSAPLATMALALTCANLGFIPFSSPIYSMINKYLIPLAIPMLLYDSDLRRIVTDTGSLLLAFGVGTIATIVGTLIAYPLVPLESLGGDMGWKVACALAARHIGGAINFVAVAETLQVSGSAVSAAIAADNVVVALYFAYLFAISTPGEGGNNDSSSSSSSSSDATDGAAAVRLEGEEYSDDDNGNNTIALPTLAVSVSVASALVFIGQCLTKALLPTGTSALPLISLLTVFSATVFPGFFANIRQSGTCLGILFIQMFFTASGAAGSLRQVIQQAPSLFLFSSLQIAIHFLALVAIGKFVFGLPSRELYLASNANVGGPTTAAAMAQAKNWKRLVMPALLIGILGYATGTGIALGLGPILLRLPILK